MSHLSRLIARWLAAGTTACLVATAAAPAQAAVSVLACEPEWAALAQALGGPLVDVSSATTAMQDPHQIQARPSLIARARKADLLLCTGADLEAGWLPVLLQQAGNPRIQPGQPGWLMAADQVPHKLDVPAQADRAQGDVHAQGNPHIQLDARNIARVATVLGTRLQQLDPAHSADYQRRNAEFAAQWQQAMARWQQRAAPLRGVAVAAQHKAYAYLEDWLGLQEVAVLEPKPGVEPSVAYLQTVLAGLRSRPARMVLYSAYQDPRPSEWLSRQTNLPTVQLPFTVGGTPAARDLFSLFDDTIDRLLAALHGKP